MKKIVKYVLIVSSLLSCLVSCDLPFNSRKIVVAHRGASGYLPEHTLEAKAVAHAMNADFIEQDLVMTKDNRVVVLHDIHLDTVTNVAEIFPGRDRSDGRFYVIDFTLEEIKQLKVTERLSLSTGQAVYAGRFPVWKSSFKVPTLEEELELIQGLNKSRNVDIGIYPEIKNPQWHREEGKDISVIVLDILKSYNYTEKGSNCYLQCFDVEETKRLRYELQTDLKLVQLISGGSSELTTPEAVEEISRYADGIGPSMTLITPGVDENGKVIITDLVELAHKNGMQVHPYTFRVDSLPGNVNSFEELLKLYYIKIGVDGIFTDFPDRAVRFLNDVKKKQGK